MPSGYTLAELAAHLDGTPVGGTDIRYFDVASLDRATAEQIGFVVDEKHLANAQASQAGALLVSAKLSPKIAKPHIVVANPRAAFVRATALFHPEPKAVPGIHPSATVAPDAVIAPDVSIGPNTHIGPNARIGAGTRIDAGVAIAEGVSIGDGCHLYPNVSVYHDCTIGDRVILHSGCVIGSDGFGFEREGNHWLKVPQIGRAVIEDDVEIGANTTVDRGALDDTVIERGAKIDNLVQIAHNVRVGANTVIAGCAGIAGSTKIGRDCLIGGAAMILGHIDIGDGVTVSGASFIGKSIKEPGVYTSTQPQMPHADWLKNAAQLRHLADMRDRIRALEKKLSEFERKSS